MKKIIGVLFAIAAVFTLIACGSSKTYEYTLTSKEILDKIENDETFIVYLGTSYCTHCATFGEEVPKYNKKYDLEISHIVLDEEDSEEVAKLLEVLPIEYTPTTFFIVEGEIKESVVGVIEEDAMLDYLETYGFITKEEASK